jgi:hypothetical protein
VLHLIGGECSAIVDSGKSVVQVALHTVDDGLKGIVQVLGGVSRGVLDVQEVPAGESAQQKDSSCHRPAK